MNERNFDEVLLLSPYDDSFPSRLLQEAFEVRVEESREKTEKLFCEMLGKTPTISNTEASEKKMRLVVDSSDDFLKDYQDGTIKLANEKGHMVAQIKNNGRYGSKLPIKEELYSDGPSSLDIQNAIQLQAIQESLIEVAEQIQAIDQNVKEVLSGQQNDRLGLYYSGVALFIEAYNVSDETFRKQLLGQSIKALSDAIFQLTLTMRTDIGYLARKEYDQNKKQKYNLINEKIANIDRSFSAIHQASIMKAAVYCYKGEIKAMLAVLQEYERFIKGTIVANAEMLSLCDSNKERTLQGAWKKRAEFQLEIGKVVKQLQAKEKYIYIEKRGTEDNESI